MPHVPPEYLLLFSFLNLQKTLILHSPQQTLKSITAADHLGLQSLSADCTTNLSPTTFGV